MNRRDFFTRTIGAVAAAVAAPYLPVAPPPVAWPMELEGLYLRVSNSPTFSFGFTGFHESMNDGTIRGYIGQSRTLHYARRQ